MGLNVKNWCLAALFALALIVSGCRPEEVIAPDEMVAIFSDFYLTDATVEVANTASTHGPVRVDSVRMYQPLLEKRGYTKEQFRSSLSYYMHRPDAMDAIFKRVIDGLEAQARQDERNEILLDTEDRDIEVADEVTVVEGAEPGIEKQPHIEKEEIAEEVKDVKDAKEVKEEKPVKEKEKPKEKERKSKRKKVSQKDLKRLEEELK